MTDSSTETAPALEAVAWNEAGLVPAIAQDAASGRVLMLAWMDRSALQQTLISGFATYWSRSRGRLWRKGESSGHTQSVRQVRLDCDSDAVLLEVEQRGGIACHTGRESCFYRAYERGDWQPPAAAIDAGPAQPAATRAATVFARLDAVLAERRGADPATSYTAALYTGGDAAIAAKIDEEADEVVDAAQNGDADHVVYEVADLWFHCMVLLQAHELGVGDIEAELARRFGVSGVDEKAARNA